MYFSKFWPGVVACTCYPATVKIELWKSMESIPAGGNITSVSDWVVRPSVIEYKEKNLAKYWNLI